METPVGIVDPQREDGGRRLKMPFSSTWDRMYIISETVDFWGNRTVVWEDDFGDLYQTIYHHGGGESTICLRG
jgi:hypothetical protein